MNGYKLSTMPVVKPLDVLEYWIGPARDDAAAALARQDLWFSPSDETDQHITHTYGETLEALQAGLAWEWANRSPRARLAAIIVLDQFSRNIHRGLPEAFSYDRLARLLTYHGLTKGEHAGLMEAEQYAFYLPLEHAEDPVDQAECVALFEKLEREARAEFLPFVQIGLEFARQHKAVIDQFGRFPYRNAILGRENTPEEHTFLAQSKT
ncbi:MAG: DUF924 family protein [Pseudomonadota bacterium]